ncbi:hypothetical protein SteCoe_2010 [Stentor coeruleus]|uniref:Uncharacterized protein n=1 Tax=Stentor coeruleus TaxID=5963 RepID=A0A1R2D088_9CILI|nr:hypothetical protein SteCoe_2010 [Stentor coeruleus]
MFALFTTKFVFRFIHIICACVSIGNAITELFWEHEKSTGYIVLHITCGVLLLISGIVNIILTKPSSIFNHDDKNTWSALVYSKLALWFFFLKFLDSIFSSLGYTFPRTEFNFFLVITIGIISVIAKNFRDNFSRKPDEMLKGME